MISRYSSPNEVEVIKMHGCVCSSRKDEIVITQEDYENYAFNRPATVQRLRNDLLTKSFLFVGYSMRDSNIRHILTEVRRLANKSTKKHYLILETKCTPDEELRQSLWCDDLKRIGVHTYCHKYQDYNDLYDILSCIASKSRGVTIYVTGSHANQHDLLAEELGRQLAAIRGLILINGQSEGIGKTVTESFMNEAINKQIDISKRIKFFYNPYSANSSFSNDESLVPEFKKWRAKLFQSTQLVVVFDGGMGTKAELEIAMESNCAILPVPNAKSEFIQSLISDTRIINRLNEFDKTYVSKMQTGSVTIEDIIKCINHMLT
jgi:hypothetical protein